NGRPDRLTIHRVRCGNMPNRLDRLWMGLCPIRAVRTRNSVMRTSRRIILALMLGATPVAAPGFAFDGAPVKPDATLPMGSPPAAAQAVTAQALKKVPPATATATAVAAPSLNSLQYAAEGGHPVSSSAAQWKLGRM